MSNRWNSLNPPPQGPYIPSTINHSSIVVGTGSTVSSWPASRHNSIITEDTTIDYSIFPFNFLKLDTTNGPVNLTLEKIPIGYMFMFQILGNNGVSVCIILKTMNGIPETITTSAPMSVAGTYVVVIFGDSVKYNTLENPIAV